MDDNCTACSERRKDGEYVLEEVTLWRRPGDEMHLPTGRWMHKDCAVLRKQDADQTRGQTALI